MRTKMTVRKRTLAHSKKAGTRKMLHMRKAGRRKMARKMKRTPVLPKTEVRR